MRISQTDITPALTGEALSAAMGSSKEQRAPLAEGFLYKQTINMFSADPGCGKSTVSTQVAVEMAAGLPVFGVFHVPRPMKVFYAQTERSIIELLERLEVISAVYPIVKENLFITDEFQKLNLLDPSHAIIMAQCIKRDCPGVDIIFIDPIYSLVAGGLSADVPASAFTHAMSMIQKETGAALYYNHHTVKQQHDQTGQEIRKKDPFYGSQWLKAHVTGSFYMKKSEHGVDLLCMKDNYTLLPKEIGLHYNQETELCSVPLSELPAIDKVRNFIRAKSLENKEFAFNELQVATKVCTRQLRKIIVHTSIADMLIVVSSIKNKNLYKAKSS